MNTAAWTSWLGVTLAAIGGVLLLAWAVGRRSTRPNCPRCGYDMSGSPSLSCPECGRVAKSERALGGRRRPRALARAGTLVILAGLLARSYEPYKREGWAGPIPLVILRAAAPLFDERGSRMVTPLSTAWVTWVNIKDDLQDFARRGLITPAMVAVPNPPTRWERALLARQGRLAADRLCRSPDAFKVSADLERITTITQLLSEEERVPLSGPMGRLVESPFDEPQEFGLAQLRQVGSRTDDHIDRIAELGRIGSSSAIRRGAYDAAAVVAHHEERAVEILRTGLSDENGYVRQLCAARLEELAKWGEPALDDLDRLIAKEWDGWVLASAKSAAEAIRCTAR